MNKKKILMSEYETVRHTFGPVYDEECTILILGSLPSVKSRETSFYYGNPQNRFWKVISSMLGCKMPATIEEKKMMLIKNHIALWDVIKECDIKGSSDSTIKNVIPNDIAGLISKTKIKKIFANGTKAKMLYEKHCLESTKIMIEKLPSTSPANASWKTEKLLNAWKAIKETP